MKKKMRVKSRRELVGLLSERCAGGQILDEFVAVTGYHRKHAIRVLNLSAAAEAHVSRARPRRYGSAVAETFLILWEASDRVCGKRLKALVPPLLAALEKHGHLSLDSVVREQVLSQSAATINRLLATARKTGAPSRREALHKRLRSLT